MSFAAGVSIMLAAGRVPPVPGPGSATGVGREAPLGARVAIVEDEVMVAWSLESVLQDLGCEVTGIFPRGEAALTGIRAEATDVVLMDINLTSGMDGIETARRLRVERVTRIIFISAYGDAETEARIVKQVPGSRLLRKPVSASQLEQALREAIATEH